MGLRHKIRRASLSIPANIAEGHGSFHRGKYIAGLSVAHAELMELETLGEAAIRRGYVTREEMKHFYFLCGETGRLIHGLANSLMRREAKYGKAS
jgi:four helix bundle protein